MWPLCRGQQRPRPAVTHLENLPPPKADLSLLILPRLLRPSMLERKRLSLSQLKNIRSISFRNFARKKFATMIAMNAFTKASVVARPTPEAPARQVKPL